MPQPWILGLTGGIGSGKTAAAAHFASLGIHTVDADHAARWVVEPGRPALTAIAEHFGEQVLQADGSLDRAALRQRIFQQPQERQWLEQLLHPLIRQELASNLQQASSPYAILVAPLLVESPALRAMTQRLLVVDIPSELQIQRTMQRDGNSEAQVRAILAAQASREERLRQGDDQISNHLDLPHLHAQIERLHQYYLSLRD